MSKPYDQVGAIMAFEQGDLDEEGTLELFQHLVDTGLAWQLQGFYGRAAKALLDQGLIHPRQRTDEYGEARRASQVQRRIPPVDRPVYRR